METTSLADAKNRLSELVATVEGTWERILITKNGKPAAVLIAPESPRRPGATSSPGFRMPSLLPPWSSSMVLSSRVRTGSGSR